MRKPSITLDAGDRRAVASGAAAGLGLMTLLALRADWVLASGVLAFRHTGQNVAAYVMGLDLLPWALVFTAVIGAGAVITFGWVCGTAPVRPSGSTERRHGHEACKTHLAGG